MQPQPPEPLGHEPPVPQRDTPRRLAQPLRRRRRLDRLVPPGIARPIPVAMLPTPGPIPFRPPLPLGPTTITIRAPNLGPAQPIPLMSTRIPSHRPDATRTAFPPMFRGPIAITPRPRRRPPPQARPPHLLGRTPPAPRPVDHRLALTTDAVGLVRPEFLFDRRRLGIPGATAIAPRPPSRSRTPDVLGRRFEAAVPIGRGTAIGPTAIAPRPRGRPRRSRATDILGREAPTARPAGHELALRSTTDIVARGGTEFRPGGDRFGKPGPIAVAPRPPPGILGRAFPAAHREVTIAVLPATALVGGCTELRLAPGGPVPPRGDPLQIPASPARRCAGRSTSAVERTQPLPHSHPLVIARHGSHRRGADPHAVGRELGR